MRDFTWLQAAASHVDLPSATADCATLRRLARCARAAMPWSMAPASPTGAMPKIACSVEKTAQLSARYAPWVSG